jgi:hypothetical protein
MRLERRRRAVVSRRAINAGGLAVAATLLSGTVAQAKTFTVTTTGDSNAAPYSGTLRGAINGANHYGGLYPGTTSKITFQSGLSGSIDLGSPLPGITSPVDIDGPGARVLTVNGGGGPQIFGILPGLAPSSISGLTITGTNGAYPAIEANSGLTLDGVTVSGNHDTRYGGGVDVDSGAALNIENSTISGNTGPNGGGIGAYGSELTIANSTITGNSATAGGGGGIEADTGTLTVSDSTISGNHAAGFGGGIEISSGATSASLDDTIVAGNSADTSGPDVDRQTGAPAPSASFSLIGNLSGSGITPDSTDIAGQDPQLGQLQNNGGQTNTMLPADNSPVIDQGKAFGAATDQRGLTRPVDLPGYPNAPGGDGADIGAVELRPSEVLPTITGLSPGSGAAGFSVVITGTHLASATKVLFGSTAATFTINSDTQITATAPAGSGTVNVRVVSPGGESPVVAADAFAYRRRVMVKQFHNQRITLTTPPLAGCTAATRRLPVGFSSTRIRGSTAHKLRFSSARFYIGKGIKHKRHGHTTYTPNAITHKATATLGLKLNGDKPGRRLLRVVVYYKTTVMKHHQKQTITVSKTVTARFRIC